MAGKIRLVRNDTRPQLVFSLTNEQSLTNDPIDLSDPAITMLFKFRKAGDTAYKNAMPVYPLPGIVLDDGSVDFTPPYDTLGLGGRCYMNWDATALDEAGDYEGELEITFGDGSIQTAFEILKFTVREDFVTP